MSPSPTSPLWLDGIVEREHQAQHPLPGNLDVDVAIVGAGYTGLWSAHYLHELDPSLTIALVDQNTVGRGASGLNGGWVSASLPLSHEQLSASYGRDTTIRLQHEMDRTVDEVGRAIRSLGIDCDYVKGGRLRVARNSGQENRLRAALRSRESFGFLDAKWLDAPAMTSRIAASGTRGGVHISTCARVHPAKLALGLATSLERRGIVIHENTRVDLIEPHRVRTECGTITADVIVRATEGFTSSLRGHRRDIAPLSALMIATEPIAPDLWDTIGLSNGEVFNDARRSVIYGQRTVDGRIAFGGRGSMYSFGNSVATTFDTPQCLDTYDRLHRTLVAMLPQLREVGITHRWGGVFGATHDGTPVMAFDRTSGLASAGGYSGYGVTTSNVAGRTLADLILRRTTDLTTLPWVRHPTRWSREPVRWLSLRASMQLAEIVDRFDDGHDQPDRWRNRMLDRLPAP